MINRRLTLKVGVVESLIAFGIPLAGYIPWSSKMNYILPRVSCGYASFKPLFPTVDPIVIGSKFPASATLLVSSMNSRRYGNNRAYRTMCEGATPHFVLHGTTYFDTEDTY